MRDPYGFYARQILRLRALDDLADTPSAAERGRYMHDVLAKFLSRVGDRQLVPDDFSTLQEIADECLQPYAQVAGIAELWGTWMQEVAAWFWEQENEQRPLRVPVVLEGKGARVFDDIGFTLKARADRIDKHRAGGAVIVDYKTGAPPSQRDVASGASPQLALEALITAGGGFDGLAPQPDYTGEYWHVAGTFDKCKIVPRQFDMQATEDSLRALVQLYLLGDAPFTALPRAPREYNDYKHLARTAEWAFAADEDGEVA
jgi:ATP-dependent helicase/nuclease subunit B